MSVSGRDVLQRARGRSPAEVILTGISAIFLAIVELTIGLWDAVIGLIRDPIGALGAGSGAIINALLGGAAFIITTGARASAAAIGADQPWVIQLFAFVYSVAIAAGGLYVLALYLQRPGSSDLLPGTFTDVSAPSWVPILGEGVGVNEDTGEDEGRG